MGVKFGLNKRWAEVDLSSIAVKDLFVQYRILEIVLLPDGAQTPVFLMLSDIQSEYSSFTGTFQALLDQLTEALPTRDDSVIIDKAVARFYDAFALRYAIKAVDDDNVEPPEPVDSSTLDHLRIERPGASIDSASAVTRVLANVNGFYHLTENIGNRGIFIRDGFKSQRLSKQNQVALWDFKELGGFTVVPTIPGAMHESGTAFQATLAQDVSQKTVFFVIAGYFFPVDGTVVSQNGSNNFLIDFAHVSMRLVSRYFEAANYIDLSTIQAIAAGQTPGSIDSDLLGQAEAIAAWMALSQTFAVIVNRKNTFVEMRYVKRQAGNPNQYLCYLDRDPSDVANEINDARLTLNPPNLPLVLELGRHPPYWVTTERWVHSFTIYNNRVGQLLFESVQPAEQVLTSGADQPGSPGMVQNAYLLEFGSLIKDH